MDLGRPAVQGILGLAAVISRVHEDLGERYHDAFYLEINVVKDGLLSRKLKAIGKVKTRFAPFVDRLPNSWTTLYELAVLSSEEFKSVVDSGLLSPFVTSQQIRATLSKSEGKVRSG